MTTVAERLFEAARRHPDKLALTNGKAELSWDELTRKIVAVRAVLETEYALKPGDAVLLAADKELAFPAVYFACHLLGVTTLPIAPDTNEKRFSLICGKTHPKLIVGFDKFAAGDTPTAAMKAFDAIEPAAAVGEVRFPRPEDRADILFTTGTTGEPKGVVLTQKNIAAAANNINTFIGNTEEDTELLALPISHSFGLGRMRCALSNGQTLVMLGSFANMKRFFRLTEQYGVAGFGMVPASWAMIRRLSGLKIAEYAGQLKYIEIGSAPMPLEEKRTLIEALPTTRVCMHYGLTEASRSTFIEFHAESDRLDTVGKPSPNMDVRILDEHGNELPAGTEGEICVRGDAVTEGYLNAPEVNRASFFGPYFRTGDWGTADAEGYITLKSRKKELINVGGKKVSPMEVEAVLLEREELADCACVAVPDPDAILGEVVKAFVVPRDGASVDFAALTAYAAKHLEGYKVPALFETIDAIPKTASGKVQRLALK